MITELIIWISGLLLIFALSLMIGKYLLQRSAAKRRYLFSATLLITSSIPLIAAALLSLSASPDSVCQNLLERINLSLPIDNPASRTSSRNFRVLSDLDAIDSQDRPDLASFAPIEPLKNIPLVYPPEPIPTQTSHRSTFWESIGEQFFPILLSLWIIGVLFTIAKMLIGVWKTNQQLKDCKPAKATFVQSLLQDASREIGLKRTPALLTTPNAISPMVCGPFQPRIIFPQDGIQRLVPEEIRAILLHELSHVKRRDLQLNLILQLSVAIQWFNPLAHWAFQQVRISQEELCDHQTIQRSDKYAYARLLLKVNQMFSIKISQCSLAAASTQAMVSRRVDQLLSDQCNRELAAGWFWRFTATFMTFLVCLPLALVAAANQVPVDTEDSDSTVIITPIKKDILPWDEGDPEQATYRLLTEWHLDDNLRKMRWGHVRYLMKFIEDPTKIERVPSNRLSSKLQADCTVGTAAMWFIDRLCCNNQFPTLNPIIVGDEETEPNAAAVRSFKAWWEMVKDWPASEAQRVNPMMFSEARWSGRRSEFPYTNSPVMALTNFLHSQRIVSVSPRARFVFITESQGDFTTGIMHKITPQGLEKQWEIERYDSAIGFALDSGLLLRTTDFHDANPTENQPDLEFFEQGKIIRSFELAKIADSRLQLQPFNLDLEMKDEQLWINAKFSVARVLRQQSFCFDTSTGDFLKVVKGDPMGNKTEKKTTTNLHQDEAIEALVSFDISESSLNKSIFQVPILDVVPAGQTKTRSEVFKALGLEETHIDEYRRKNSGHVEFLSWRVSPSYRISMMTGTRTSDDPKVELADPQRQVYGVRIIVPDR